jgi:hypothetical protein
MSVSLALAIATCGGGVSGPIIPASGLVLDLNADTGLSGSGSHTWADQSGHGNDFVTSTNPTVNPTGIGGHQAMQGNGSNAIFVGPNGNAVVTTSAAERFMVLLPDYAAGAPFDGGWGTGASEFLTFVDEAIYSDFYSSTRPSAPSGRTSGPIILDQLSGGGTTTWNLNGAQIYNATNTFAANTGALGLMGAGWLGMVARVLVWDRVLTSQERTDVLSVLNAKYSVF